MNARWCAALTIACVGAAGGHAHAAELESTTTPYAGVVHTVWTEAAIPARAHVIAVDLSSSELSLRATTAAQRGQTPSGYAAATSAEIAINGDSFSPLDLEPAGLAMGDAVVWPGSADDAVAGFISFDLNDNRAHVLISPPASEVAASDLPVGTQGVVGGRPLLVQSGVPSPAYDCADLVAMPCQRAPRTAVAVSADGNTLWLVVVDGWQAGSLGMTAAELAAFVDALGAHDALMLDSGSSSALYVANEGGLVSSPSDGVERVVANHLAVHFGALPPGQMAGVVRERDIFDEGANIAGATVKLDDDQTDVTGADGLYSFAAVAPRYVCATASAPGYHPETRCKQVESGVLVYNSIPLFPNAEFIDAGPGSVDAGLVDAAPRPDARAPGDGGTGAGGDAGPAGGGGGCRASGAGATPATLLVLALALGLRPKRAR